MPYGKIDCRELVREEQIKTTYRLLPVSCVGAPSAAALLSFLCWNSVDHWLIVAWLVSIALTNGVGAGLLYLAYKRTARLPLEVKKWGTRMTGFAALSGCLWGAIGLLFFLPDSHEHQLIVFLWLMTLASLMMSAMVAYKPSFYAMTFPLLVPIAIRSFVEMDVFHIFMSATIVVYYGCILYFYKNNHTTFLEALRLRFVNIGLIEELTVQKEEAEQANRAKSQFLAAASHDLRQPVHAQGLFLAELDSYVNHPDGRRILAGLESSVDAMRGLFDTLLDISRLDAGTIQPSITDFPIKELFNELEFEYRAESEDRGIQFHLVPCSAIVRSDRALLSSVIRNLISNAFRYTPRGRILAGCRRHNNDIRIEVWDTGIGIPDNQQQNIFSEFYQIGNPERDREKGLGLGLAIVRRIGQLLDHPITVRSTPGKGSTFSITVPGSQPAAKQADNARFVIDHGSLSGKHVIVIDDEALVLQAIGSLLQAWGCKVLVAASAEEALGEMVRSEHKADVIVADYRLRNDKTGVQAIEAIQNHLQEKLPAILITGDTSPERLREAHGSGYPILHKPVHPAKLHAVLNNRLRKL